jgi:hypothetical protein
MMDLSAARRLLDFNVKMGSPERAEEQLKGSVAIHNILEQHGIAYLADEVGMGKTYVALGAIALFRHFQPNFRVLVIAPRVNIQDKWRKELVNFIRDNVRYPDLRVKGLDGGPARPSAKCESLRHLVHEAALDPNRDFFMRMTSFSPALSDGDQLGEQMNENRRELLRHLPWLPPEVFDARQNRESFRDNLGKAVCCALPVFDLVVVDEAHVLKHGIGGKVATRNVMLNLALGFSPIPVDTNVFRGYRPRARRILLLSATPVEDTYDHLLNQMKVFDRSKGFDGLGRDDIDEQTKKRLAGRILIRRVTKMRVDGKTHTKNMYRREWRAGGVEVHDNPIAVADDRRRLVVALVQKKVSELLADARFGAAFQIGMLASFESFQQTFANRTKEGEEQIFDDASENASDVERRGVDVGEINRLAKSYRAKFKAELPHPKMDALVDALRSSWAAGRKSLIFVRRVASVVELRRRLNIEYDTWLRERMRRELPLSMRPGLDDLWKDYYASKDIRRESDITEGQDKDDEADTGGTDTFFAWFFRGEPRPNVISGATIQQRFINASGPYATFFEDNYAADLLGCRPQDVFGRLTTALGVPEAEWRSELMRRAAPFFGDAKKVTRRERFHAAQAATVSLLKDTPGPWQALAREVWHAKFEGTERNKLKQTPDVAEALKTLTFFTELRTRPALRQALWPAPASENTKQAFREREQRAEVLASAARLGHAFIDLYCLTMRRIGSFAARTREADGDGESGTAQEITEYLDLLEAQMASPPPAREWGAYDELAEIAAHHSLILDVNAHELRDAPLPTAAREFGKLLGRQQPVAGMAAQINRTLIRQFRMPGYPFVLVTTDLLQEGEDLHTFCSSVYHYGISWTPSAMEQRIGRIDRVRSQTERRLGSLARALHGDDKLQVFLPYLEDTVEVLQIDRVLERMNTFLRLMHEGLIGMAKEEGRIHTSVEFNRGRPRIEQIDSELQTAFDIEASRHLEGTVKDVAVDEHVSKAAHWRFDALHGAQPTGMQIAWEPKGGGSGLLMGTVRLAHRIQPFKLLLKSFHEHLALRCISPVGCVGPDNAQDRIVESTQRRRARVGAILTPEPRTYDLTVEDEVLLASSADSDLHRLRLLLQRVTEHADALEQEHLPGRDQPLATFEADLRKEGAHG